MKQPPDNDEPMRQMKIRAEDMEPEGDRVMQVYFAQAEAGDGEHMTQHLQIFVVDDFISYLRRNGLMDVFTEGLEEFIAQLKKQGVQ